MCRVFPYMSGAWKIECITRSQGRITHFGGRDGSDTRWELSAEELIREVELGERICYVTFEGESYLVTVRVDADGKKSLHTLLGDLRTRLPECRR